MRSATKGFLATALCGAHICALASEPVTRAPFGILPDGRSVEAITLHGSEGIRVVVINYGATLQSVVLPDHNGKLVDVIVGPGSLPPFLEQPQYFGATVGRFANRLANGAFRLEGKSYQTPRNNNGNSLHGGERGFDKVLWDIVQVGEGGGANVTLRYRSPDGDQGYPGTLTASAIYTLAGAELRIDYRASTDAPTIVNLTNHAYWNLAGEGSAQSALEQRLTIPAETYTPVTAGLVPTGEFRKVENSSFDFRTATKIGARVREARDEQIVRGRGYDHNFVIAQGVGAEVRLHAKLEDPVSGRAFELWSNQPGLQLYSGNFLDGTTVGKSGRAYRQGDAIVLEPQLFPDTPNQPVFGSALLAPGEEYRNLIVYRFPTRKSP